MPKKSRVKRLEDDIDNNLRRVYSEAVQEQVPDRFTKLLEQLRQQESEDREDGHQV
ncbi:RNA polymerase subunit sigma-70 [Pseudohalocynthiibacter aestuariivivens]|uniref:NepR family anti-sigma factor n=1 Tax=Roseovarius pelagicus TaxID=2980108 RepID=A0ABY6DD94_9RHOB|nr:MULTISPECIES: NepR family anti-sigma factor [Rhodobacterales]QIE47327.1 RNA polymerase subunit sigma-70 [Pseudohalocynthiibacter aestuariivivens]UXX84112.1 NepR family anti-sigma factor [Roseovarius pelagicus]